MCIRDSGINDAPAGAGPARYWHFPGATGTVGFISAMSNHFCANCNQMCIRDRGDPVYRCRPGAIRDSYKAEVPVMVDRPHCGDSYTR